MGYAALALIYASAVVLLAHYIIRRECRAMREALLRETGLIERRMVNTNGETRVLVAHALSSAARAARAAERAEKASDRSAIASDVSAERAEEARCRAQEAGMWARVSGAARARPVELPRRCDSETEPAAEG